MTLEQKIRTVDKLCDERSCMDCPCCDDRRNCLSGRREKPWFVTPEYLIDEALKKFGKYTPYTHFDRIKAMSVEEMAEDLTKLFYKVASYTNAKDYIKQYLESEVQEDV